jgi:hypothetical protein
MRTVKPLHACRASEVEDPAAEAESEVSGGYDTPAIVRVSCPECDQPIALLADEDELPEHALCPTRWDPFGLTVCRGSGRSALDAPPAAGVPSAEEDTASLLTLPEGLDWRTQPFSHARRGRPVRAVMPSGRAA